MATGSASSQISRSRLLHSIADGCAQGSRLRASGGLPQWRNVIIRSPASAKSPLGLPAGAAKPRPSHWFCVG